MSIQIIGVLLYNSARTTIEINELKLIKKSEGIYKRQSENTKHRFELKRERNVGTNCMKI